MARNTSPKDQCALDGSVLAALRDCKKGEFIRRNIGGPVWVRGEYDRSTKTFCVYKFDDVNHCANWKSGRLVFVDFSF